MKKKKEKKKSKNMKFTCKLSVSVGTIELQKRRLMEN